MTDRTEELGLAHRLPIVVGGVLVELRTLNLDESDKWQERIKGVNVQTDLSPDLMLDLVVAYDVEHVLGARAQLRKKFTRQELWDALNQMASAEFPLEMVARSVAEASGVTAMGPFLFLLANQLATQPSRSPRESSTNGRSPTGESTTGLSVVASAKKAS